MTAGAAVNTVGMATFFRPESLRPCSTRSVQVVSCSRLMWGQPMKHSFGLAPLSFHITG